MQEAVQTTPGEVLDQSNGLGQSNGHARFSGISESEFPILHRNGAFPLVQDRWERLVSQVALPAPAAVVWETLTEPGRVANWLAIVRGDWAVPGAEAILDFEDGEFFLTRADEVSPPEGERPGRLVYHWRWVGIGPATKVTWQVAEQPGGRMTLLTATEEAFNPPSDWRSWNGMGWPGILDQFADHLRTGTGWRWPWRRMGPYVQTELPGSAFEVWQQLISVPATQFWLNRAAGSLDQGQAVELILGDASGVATLSVQAHVEANQQFPSFLPRIEFTLARPGWPEKLSGHLWIEPAGVGRSLLQVFHSGWEALSGSGTPLSERKIVTDYWVGAFGRAALLLAGPPAAAGPHSWSL